MIQFYCRIARQIRCFDTDGDPVPYNMKVKVDFLNMDTDDIVFESFNAEGFSLNNGIRVIGPCVAFPQMFLQWKVSFICVLLYRLNQGVG